jgi:Mg2+ and Co2+ transporter CorA
MAQKDAKVNIALAESSAAIAQASKEDSAVMRTIAIESKKDSSAMKTIAVLGMFFLPGTFVAAIFAMPMFDWDGNTPIIKPGFKYYWAVTAPLTLFVLLSWALAMLLPWKLWLSMVNRGRRDSNGEVELTI